MKIAYLIRGASFALTMLAASITRLPAQLAWSAFDETSSKSVPGLGTSNGVVVTVPAGQRTTLYATNFVPVDFTSVTSGEVYVTVSFKASGGLSSIAGGTRAVGFGFYNNNGTTSGTTFSDDAGYFTWLNGRNTGSLIELRRRNADGTSPSLLNPTGSAFNSLGTGTTVQTAGALSDSGIYSIQLHLIRTATGVSLGNTSSTTTGAGIWVSGDGLSQTAYTNPDTPPAATLYNEVGFMFYNSTAADVTLTLVSLTGLTAINAPTIAAQPAALSVNPGQSGSLTVGANGTAPLTYQWRKDGTNISGATSATYTLTNAQTTDAGSYTVVITNAYGTITSAAAAVTVTTQAITPTITAQPVALTVSAGQAATFAVTAYGSAPLTFQWLKNGAAIAGATASTYSIAAATAGDAGNYSVMVTNASGTATSTAVALTVNTAPVITTQPVGATVSPGQSVTFTVLATGNPTPTYQWLRNGINIAGATGSSYTVAAASFTNTGVYTVRIVNSVGAVTSAAAVLAIPSTMAVTAVTPANGVSGRNTDVTLSITFDRVPAVGVTGRIRIFRAADNVVVDTIDLGAAVQTRMIGTQTVAYIYYPIIVTGNTAAIYPHAGVLAYGQTYYVTVEPGALQDSTGASFSGISDPNYWRFTTKAAGPPATATAITVAADGTGDFNTVQGAIDFVPLNNAQRVVITVRKGVYTEICYVGAAKPLITIQGEDRAQTTIAYANNNNFNTLTGNNRVLFGVDANDFILQTISLHNTTPLGGSQAEAFRGNAQRILLNRVNLASYQDTFLINGTSPTAFITDSYIEGDVDFMWGSGSCYFQRCELKALNPGYYTQIRNTQTQIGNVYVDCRLTSAPGVTNAYLGRIDPTPGNFPYSQAVYINCAMGPQVPAVGWLLNNATSAPNIKWWEYKSTDLNGAALDVSKRLPDSKQIDDATAQQYRDPAFVLGGWSPVIPVTIESISSAQSFVAGSNARLAVVANGSPQPTFQWYKDGVALNGATSSTLVLPNIQSSAAGNYSVSATNSQGTVTTSLVAVTVSRGPFAGVYTGTMGTSGMFALYIRDNNSGVFIASDRTNGGMLSRQVYVDASGHVTFALGSGMVGTSPGALGDLTINSSGAIAGTLGGASGLAIAGSRSAGNGALAGTAGFYQMGATATASTADIIVSTTGQAIAVVQNGTSLDSGVGTADSTGRVAVATTGGQNLVGSLGVNGGSSFAVLSGAQGSIGLVGSSDAAAPGQRFQAFSARARVGTGDNVVIAGFTIVGDTPDNVLVRAIGPSLANFGVGGTITNPRLDLYSGANIIATNTGWTTSGNATDIAAAAATVGAFPLGTTTADSAIRQSLAPGSYTAIMSGGAGGVGLVEIYDLSMGAAGQRLADLSTRAPVTSGDGTLIAGVIVSGTVPKRLLVRAVGPTLTRFGINGVLAKPVLTVYQGNRAIAQNSSVANSTDAAAIATAATEGGTFSLTTGAADSALLLNLAPGSYTAQVTSGDGTPGIALVEVLELP